MGPEVRGDLMSARNGAVIVSGASVVISNRQPTTHEYVLTADP